jgi:hypothetical protein
MAKSLPAREQSASASSALAGSLQDRLISSLSGRSHVSHLPTRQVGEDSVRNSFRFSGYSRSRPQMAVYARTDGLRILPGNSPTVIWFRLMAGRAGTQVLTG